MKNKKKRLSMDDLIGYPQGSLGYQLGQFLFRNSYEPDPIPGKEDVYRLLITEEASAKEDIAMYFYLFGNGNTVLNTILMMGAGALLYPLQIKYFYKKYRDGKNALRFYDLNYFRMLHLPLQRIKDTFLIR